MKKWLKKSIGQDVEFRERVFRVIIIVSTVLAFLGMMESFIFLGLIQVAGEMVILFVTMGISLILVFKYKKTDIAAIMVCIVIITIVFPETFLASGGLQGGAMVWFVMAIWYMFLMFRGKRLVILLCVNIIAIIATYVYAYQIPEVVNPLPTEQLAYFDSFFSIVVVGIAGGLVLKFQSKVFFEEKAVTLKQKEELEKVSDSKNVFFANMSHEIRTPINTIIGLNEMILREDVSDAVRENAENIQKASKMLLNLVNDILDLSQIEMKKMELTLEEYESKELFVEIVDLISVRMQEKKLQFLIDIDQSIPKVLMGDKKRINQIILNLLANAVKYTETGSVTFTVRSERVDEDTVNIKVSVVDTGMGIKKEDIEHLYEAFKRVDTQKNNRIEGSGLGLSITKELVDMMGGEITVDSIYTKGSTFTVSIEQKIVDSTSVGKISFEKKVTNESAYYRQKFEAPEARVLIVDDNDMNLMVAKKLLAATKVKIDTATSGKETLEMTKEKYFDVILMDYMMPGLDGADTLKLMRKQENGLCREVPVIALTANTMAGARQMYEDFGFDGYLEKPINADLLEEEVLRCIPEELIEYRAYEGENEDETDRVHYVAGRKKKKVYITTDSSCDLPEELIEKYDIKIRNLYIKTKEGRFSDSLEIDSNNISRYLLGDGNTTYADSASVEEYEEFFADILTRGEQLIHISLAQNAGKSYSNAVIAAKGFGHVHIINSGHISGGQGLVVLYAAKLAMEGFTVAEICEKVEKIRNNIKTEMVIPDVEAFYRNGYTNQFMYKLFKRFKLRPVLTIRKSKVIIKGALVGSMESTWKRAIKYSLIRKRKINTDIIIVTHVGCSIRQQEFIKNEILKNVKFERVIIQKGSVSNACNSGVGAVTIAFYEK